jgi:Rhodanese-like domain
MKTQLLLFLTATTLVFASPVLMGQNSIPNPLIDYNGFQKIVDTADKERESRRLTEDQFLNMSFDPDAVVLDARSAAMYRLRHIKGAVNLPFTDFSATSLAGMVPNKDTKILIYCNNNFLNDPVAMFSKVATASLNLSTYTSLKSYGYDNIYELGPLLDVNKTKIPFEGTEIR